MKWDWGKRILFLVKEITLYLTLLEHSANSEVSEETALGYIMNNVVSGDFSEREAPIRIKNVYKRKGVW